MEEVASSNLVAPTNLKDIGNPHSERVPEFFMFNCNLHNYNSLYLIDINCPKNVPIW